MSLHARLLLAALLASACAAAPSGRRVDPDAIGEARRPEPPGRYASPRAIAHYVDARRSAAAGDWARAAAELQLAVGHDDRSPELRVALAEALALTGRIDAAEAEARRALELDRSGLASSEAHVLLGKIHSARKQPERAVLELRQAIRIETDLAAAGETPNGEPWRLLAEVYFDQGDEGAASRVLDDGAVRVPGDSSGFREMGRAALEKRDPGHAERYLKRAVEIDRTDLEALRLLAQAHEGLRRTPEARADHLAVLKLDPDDAAALLALGKLSLEADDVDAAREWFARLVRAAQDPVDARLKVSFQWLEAKRPAEALAVARDGLADAPDARLQLAAGLALQDLRRWTESATVLSAVKVESGDVWITARVSLAYGLSRAGRHAEAEKALDGPLSARPGEVRLVTMRAYVLDRAGRASEAQQLLHQAIDDHERSASDQELPELVEALAESLSRAGRGQEAVDALRAAVASRPRDVGLLYALGTAYERAGKGDAAVAQMRALLALEPDHPDALNFVGYSYAEQGVRLDEAERLVRRALEIRPRSGYILDSLGWVHFRRGEYARAIDALEKADALAGPEASILEHLGDAYRAAARPGDAAGAYRRALKCVSDEPPADQVRMRASLERKLRDTTAGDGRPVAR